MKEQSGQDIIMDCMKDALLTLSRLGKMPDPTESGVARAYQARETYMRIVVRLNDIGIFAHANEIAGFPCGNESKE